MPDPFLLRGIGRTVRLSDKTVVRVFTGVHGAHAIQLPYQNRGEQMVYGEGIVWMPRQDLLEIHDGRVVIEVVIVLKSRLVQRVGGTKCVRCVRSQTIRSQT